MSILMSTIPEAVSYPMWALVVVFLMNAFKDYLPFISSAKSVHKCNEKCKKLEADLNALRAEHDIMLKNYYKLLGATQIIRTKLKELGYDDIPELESNT